MTDPEFEAELREALIAPGPPRGDLVQAIRAQVARGDRARRALLAGAMLAGLAAAAGGVAVAAWLEPGFWGHLPTLRDPGPLALAATGIAAALLAAGVSALREV